MNLMKQNPFLYFAKKLINDVYISSTHTHQFTLIRKMLHCLAVHCIVNIKIMHKHYFLLHLSISLEKMTKIRTLNFFFIKREII